MGAGVIDRDYRGPLGVILFNFDDKPFVVNRGDRIAQLLLIQNSNPEIELVTEIEATERNMNGFGSTGTIHKLMNLK